MNSYRKELWFEVKKRRDFINITGTIAACHLGPWEQVFYGEFDGMRRKRVLVKIIGE